jgi:hypothetical protein
MDTDFAGALAHGYDNVTITPTDTALRKLLKICDDYVRDYNISFNAAKTKRFVVAPNACRTSFEQLDDYPFFVSYKPIEFVMSFTHLGQIISSSLRDDDDILGRRNDFVGKLIICCVILNVQARL